MSFAVQREPEDATGHSRRHFKTFPGQQLGTQVEENRERGRHDIRNELPAA